MATYTSRQLTTGGPGRVGWQGQEDPRKELPGPLPIIHRPYGRQYRRATTATLFAYAPYSRYHHLVTPVSPSHRPASCAPSHVRGIWGFLRIRKRIPGPDSGYGFRLPVKLARQRYPKLISVEVLIFHCWASSNLTTQCDRTDASCVFAECISRSQKQ